MSLRRDDSSRKPIGDVALPALIGFLLLAISTTSANADDLFRDQVVPLLQRRCLSCHNDAERKGEFSLESAASLARGGESGEVIVVGKPDESRFIEVVTPSAGEAEMPKDADPLSAAEVDALRAWVAAGAPWPDGFRLEMPAVKDTDWWSLKPIARPALPTLDGDDQTWADGPIDLFLAERQRAMKLVRAPSVDRRTLARRLSFDLIGLPPEPAEMEEFLGDHHADARERLVDRLLASPAFGERWARHWLDVVHFGETHGYDKDKPRPNAWPYRDYVIRAFNEDRPYRQFIEEQIAGDVLYPGTMDGLTGLGFLAAGPWDLIGHEEVPETKTDGKIARHLDRDDMVATTINTFCSLTVHCAQCHHHKFDPITQEDYYRLHAVFAAVDRTNKGYDLDPAVARQRTALLAQKSAAESKQKALVEQVHALAGPQLAELDQQLEKARSTKGKYPAEHGYHSAIEVAQDVAKWVQLDLGEPRSLARIEAVACHDDFAGIGEGFGFPARFVIDASDDPNFTAGVERLVDRSADDVPNPKVAPVDFELPEVKARYVRFTALKLAPRQNDFIFALAELRVIAPDGTNLAEKAVVTALDSIEAAPRWRKENLVDGIYPRSGPDKASIPQLEESRRKLIAERVDPKLLAEEDACRAEMAAIQRELAKLPPQSLAYIAAVHTGSGAFQGTGAKGGDPRPIHLLLRGDVTKPGPEMKPGTIAALAPGEAEFALPLKHGEGDRRAALAQWLVRAENPLTWRSMANRVWLYHFGQGIVDTPNDFGRMGETPTHPELLDWLAIELRDGSMSLKDLHRQMVTSAAYRLAATEHPGNVAVDRDNRYLWRGHRRKLEAEALRDAVIAVSGTLDRAMGGPSFQDFVIEKPEHSPHYQYHRADYENHALHRRSVYRFLVRSQQQPWMATMDCADPSMLVDKRNETISPLQALALWNDELVLAMADHFAQRLKRERSTDEARIDRAYLLALGRLPSDEERSALVELARDRGLPAACRLIFNLNEFAFVD